MKTKFTLIGSLLISAFVTTIGETKKFAWDDTNPPGVVTNFIVYVSSTQDTSNLVARVNTATNTTVTFKDLPPGDYFASVQAQASPSLLSPLSAWHQFTVRPNPNQATNLVVSSVVELVWSNSFTSGNIKYTIP